jgi:nitrite reductase/ring-hydroxylating ferredoxin subunit
MLNLVQMIAFVTLLSLLLVTTAAWSTVPINVFKTKRSIISMKRGRGSLGKEVGFGDSNTGGMGSGSTSRSSGGLGGPVINWIPIAVSSKELPTEDNTVGIIDTNLPTMKVGQTNPTGAVSVLKYKDEVHCFSINCPSCQIPLTKAKAVPADESSAGQPRLVCDFCKATYNIKTGEKLKSAVENPGLLGGIAKSLFSAKDSGNLKMYKLGEKNGKLLIALD